MTGFRRGTTPTHNYDVNVNLTSAKVFITYSQDGKVVVEKTGDAITKTASQLTVVLTQEETLRFRPGIIDVQIRYIYPNGSADASGIMRMKATEILKDGEIYP